MTIRSFSLTEILICTPLLVVALWMIAAVGMQVLTWHRFQNGIINAARNADVETIANKYAITLEEGKERIEFVKKANPQLTVEEFNPSQTEVDKSTRDEIGIFIRSYSDLWDSKFVASFQKPLELADSYSVVLWFYKDDAYHGVVIQNVVKTKNGLKVNDWNGWRPNDARVKRAQVRETNRRALSFPAEIKYEYGWE